MKFKTRIAGLILALLTVLVFTLYLGRAATKKDRANTEGYDLQALRKLPVLEGGRVKPLDTVARSTLRIISGGEEYEDAAEKKQPAIKWLADAMFSDVHGVHGRKFSRTGPAWEAKIFRIDNEQLVGMLGLKARPGLRYSLAEFYDRIGDLQREVAKAEKVAKNERDLYQNKLLEFEQHVTQFLRLSHFAVTLIPPAEAGAGWDSQYAKKKSLMDDPSWFEQARAEAAGAVRDRHKLDDKAIQNMPPGRVDELMQEVKNEIELRAEREVVTAHPHFKSWIDLRDAYREGKVDEFNSTLAKLSEPPAHVDAKPIRKTKLEVFVNHFAPFFQVTGMYVFVLVLALIGLVLFAIHPDLSRLARWPAFALMLLAFTIHVTGIGVRMYLQDRPPVTNLYSSAIFIGAGAVALALIVELIYSYGAASFVGGLLGYMTGVIAHQLNLGSGDSLEMMQAVLDTNFWLATHVVLVTLGYVATYVAGAFGVLFILSGVFTPLMNRDFFKAISNVLYGVVCFATLLSFVGTVLGGIWADQSWGRFWGWDPKENGAVLVVIWNTIILHARWAGLVQQRGMAVLATLGNIVVAWSWFGTNLLGVGLHAYGFTSFGFWMMVGSVGVSVPIAALGAIWPPKNWMSYGGRFDAPLNAAPA